MGGGGGCCIMNCCIGNCCIGNFHFPWNKSKGSSSGGSTGSYDANTASVLTY